MPPRPARSVRFARTHRAPVAGVRVAHRPQAVLSMFQAPISIGGNAEVKYMSFSMRGLPTTNGVAGAPPVILQATMYTPAYKITSSEALPFTYASVVRAARTASWQSAAYRTGRVDTVVHVFGVNSKRAVTLYYTFYTKATANDACVGSHSPPPGMDQTICQGTATDGWLSGARTARGFYGDGNRMLTFAVRGRSAGPVAVTSGRVSAGGALLGHVDQDRQLRGAGRLRPSVLRQRGRRFPRHDCVGPGAQDRGGLSTAGVW